MEEEKNDPKSTTISEDIVEEILQHLSMKSLARFKAVSKLWRSVIEATYFFHKRLVCLGLQTPNVKLLVVDQQSSKLDEDSNSRTLLLKTFSRDHDNNGQICLSSSSVYTFHDNPVDESIRVLGSCDGLVLVQFYNFRYIYLINPTTREHQTLPPASSEWPLAYSYTNNPTTTREISPSILHYQPGDLRAIMPFTAGFGKDIVTKTYKVILMYRRPWSPWDRGIFKIKVISLNNGEQRDIGFYNLTDDRFCDEQTSVYANGSLFWLTSIKHRIFCTLSLSWPRLLAIDLHTEKLRWISLPYTDYSRNLQMWSLNDHLCISDVLQYPDLEVWSLRHENLSDKWEKIFSFNIFNIGRLDFWMLGLAEAYFRRTGENRDQDQVFGDGLTTTLYSPTLISPLNLVL